MILHRFLGGPFQENGFLLVDPDERLAVVVDPGGGTPEMVDHIREEKLRVAAILLTHAHLDHVDGIPLVRDVAPDAPLYLNTLDRPLYDAAPQQGEAFGLPVPVLPTPERALAHGDVLEFGSIRLRVRFAPGHAPGHVILVAEEDNLALVGDVIFQGSIGRTDLPGGDFATLMAAIRDQVLTLPDDMTLYPGHGPETTVGRERRGNPFVLQALGR